MCIYVDTAVLSFNDWEMVAHVVMPVPIRHCLLKQSELVGRSLMWRFKFIGLLEYHTDMV